MYVDTGYPFVFLISKNNKDQGFKTQTLETKHKCDLTFHNRRTIPNALAHYFQNKAKYKSQVQGQRHEGDYGSEIQIKYQLF